MAYRDSTTNGATSGTTSSVNVPAGVVAGDIVTLKLSRDSTTAFGTWPAGFTEILNVALSVVDTQRVGVAWKRLTAADTGTYTCGAAPGANDWVMQATAYSGRHATDPPVLSSTTNDAANAIGAGLAITAPSVTALAGDDLEFACLPDTSVADGTVATTPPSGYTEAKDQEANFGYAENAYKENVSAGATGTVTGTLTASGGNAGYVAVHIRIPVAVAAGAAPPPPTQPILNPGGVPMAQTLLAPGKSTSYGPVRWQEWEKYPWGPPGAPVTIALTGTGITFSTGLLAPSTDVPLTGATETYSAGILTPSNAVALLGVLESFAAGALGVALDVRLAGTDVLFNTGTLTPSGDVTVALTGTAITFSTGALGVSVSVPLVGITETYASGALVLASAVPLAGVAETYSQGALAPSAAVAIAGTSVLFNTGSMTATAGGDVTVALTGIDVIFQPGTLTPSGGDSGAGSGGDWLIRMRRRGQR